LGIFPKRIIMNPDQNNYGQPEGGKLPGAETGNASNPNPHDTSMEPASGNQLLDEKAEKYLRESASVEDYPDPQERQELDDKPEEENGR
jgi:hypothetical protein